MTKEQNSLHPEEETTSLPEETGIATGDGEESASGLPEARKTANEAAIRRYLSGESGTKKKQEKVIAEKKSDSADSLSKEKGKTTLIKRQTIAITVLAALLVVLIPVYFAVILPLVSQNASTGDTEALKPQDGEVITASGNIGMMPSLGLTDVAEMDIHNDTGDWGFIYHEEHGTYYLKDYQKAIFDTSTWTTMLYQFGTAAISDRILTGDDINWAEYGLSDEDTPNYVTILTRDGATHRILLGKMTATGNGYYACYENEGNRRNTVYIVNSYMGMCADMSMYDLLNPIVTVPLNQEDYVPDLFEIYRNGQIYVKIRLLTQAEAENEETAKNSHVFTANGMEYDASSTYSAMLYDQLQGGISGLRVVEISKDDEELSADVLAKYGIRVPGSSGTSDVASGETSEGTTIHPDEQPYRILSFKKDGIPQELLFSEKTENDTYYVYVMLYDMIVEVAAEEVDFIEWDLKKYVDASIFLMPIYSVTELTVNSMAVPDAYVTAGVPRVNETFHITSKLTTAADGETTSIVTKVTADSLGGNLPDPKDSTGIANFQYYYLVLMTIGVQLDVPEEVLSELDMEKPDVTISLKTAKEKEHTLRFYFYNSRHAYYTLDGEGQFYVVYDELTKFLSDTVSLINGENVNWETKNNTDVTVDDKGDASIDTSDKNEQQKDPADETLPKPILVIAVIAVVLVVGGVGGFAVYAYLTKRKKSGQK